MNASVSQLSFLPLDYTYACVKRGEMLEIGRSNSKRKHFLCIYYLFAIISLKKIHVNNLVRTCLAGKTYIIEII